MWQTAHPEAVHLNRESRIVNREPPREGAQC
jgi:hypothetical protein